MIQMIFIILLSAVSLKSVTGSTFNANLDDPQGAEEARNFDIVERYKKSRAKVVERKLPFLTSKTHFAGEFFEIYDGDTEKLISFSDSSEQKRLQAATTYFHLNFAFQFFKKNMDNWSFPGTLPIKIRIDVKRGYSSKFYFLHPNIEEFNTAISLLPGQHLMTKQQWGHEIWFRPAKKIPLKDLLQGSDYRSIDQLFNTFKKQIHRNNFQRFIADLARYWSAPENSQIQFQGWRTVGSSFLLEGIYALRYPIVKALSPKHIYLDSALVPEIIYHEFVHIALSDKLPLTVANPVIEGVADFFATLMSGRKNLGDKIRKYSTLRAKKGGNKKTYSPEIEFQYSNDFLLALFWDLVDHPEFGVEETRKLVEYALPFLDENASLKYELQDALVFSCEMACSNARFQLRVLKKKLALRFQ